MSCTHDRDGDPIVRGRGEGPREHDNRTGEKTTKGYREVGGLAPQDSQGLPQFELRRQAREHARWVALQSP